MQNLVLLPKRLIEFVKKKNLELLQKKCSKTQKSLEIRRNKDV